MLGSKKLGAKKSLVENIWGKIISGLKKLGHKNVGHKEFLGSKNLSPIFLVKAKLWLKNVGPKNCVCKKI